MTTLEEISALTRPNHPDDWTELDSLAVDTVRVLAADAVQKVGNGHPGTAMSLAPLAYTLFQRQMRHDPSDVHWLGRDRFVLSVRAQQPHAVHPAVPRRVRPRARRHRVAAHLEVQDAGPPGVPPHQGRGDHHRPAGPGPGLGGRHGDGGALRARAVRPRRRAGHQPVRPLHLRDRLRRRHGGGRHQRGVVAGGHPAARQPDRVLRQQPDLDRARHQHRAVRGRRRPATAPTAGTCRRSRAARTSSASRRPSPRPRGSPTSRRSSRCARSSAIPRPTKMNTGGVHGSALGDDEVAATKKVLGFDPDKTFEVRDEVIEHTRKLVDRGKEAHEKWQAEFDAWAEREPERKKLLDRLTGAGAARRLGRRPARTGSRAPSRWPPAPRSARCSTTSRPSCPNCGAARRIWRAATTPPSRA